jgi:hypothetical protein
MDNALVIDTTRNVVVVNDKAAAEVGCKAVGSYSTSLENDDGCHDVFCIPPLLLKLAPFLAH